MELTQDAVQRMLSHKHSKEEALTVDVRKFRRVKSAYLTVRLSDGDKEFKAIVEVRDPSMDLARLAEEQEVKQLTIVVKEHVTHFKGNEPLAIELVDFDVLTCHQPSKKEANYPHLAGIKMEDPLSESNRKKAAVKQESLYAPKSHQVDTGLRQGEEPEETRPEQPEEPVPSFNIRQFEKISDLYENMSGWVLLVRLVDKSYREFISKGGAYIKLLTLQLIDRTGNTIEASVFSHKAELYNDKLREGKVYRIS